MPLGTVAVLNLMKVAPNDYEKYEKAESKPSNLIIKEWLTPVKEAAGH
jgi:hypothetical protein